MSLERKPSSASLSTAQKCHLVKQTDLNELQRDPRNMFLKPPETFQLASVECVRSHLQTQVPHGAIPACISMSVSAFEHVLFHP